MDLRSPGPSTTLRPATSLGLAGASTASEYVPAAMAETSA
jgi:hypothetical protein